MDVNVDVDTDLTAPIAGAVAANANVAAPISAAVSANVGSVGSDADAISTQDAVINQDLRGTTTASADQVSDVAQGTSQPDAGGTTGGDTPCQRRRRFRQRRLQWGDQQRFAG